MTTFLEFAARGKNAWWRYLVAVVLALTLAVVIGAVVLIGLELTRALPRDIAAELEQPTHPLTYFTAAGVTFGVVLVGFIAAIRLVHGKRFADVIGLWQWSMFLRGAGMWALVLVALALVDLAIAPQGFKITVNSATAILAVSASIALAIQAFAEEFVFRGYLTQSLLLATRRPFVAAGLSGLAFGALHIPNGLSQAAFAFCFGVVTALIAIRTGGIAFSYGLHLVNNVFAAVVLVSAGDVFKGSPALFTQNTPQLLWWDFGTSLLAVVLVGWLVVGGRMDHAGWAALSGRSRGPSQ